MKKVKLCLMAVTILCNAGSYAQSDKQGTPRATREEPATAADVDKLKQEDNYALPWPTIWERDILWKKRVWRTVDSREKKNAEFNNNATGTKTLANILLTGFLNSHYDLYNSQDDRFTKKLTKQEAADLLSDKSGFELNSITKYRIKENWLYLDTERIVVARIVGIAPMIEIKAADGLVTDQPLFWAYYPDTRLFLATQQVGHSTRNWDQLLDRREFSGTINKIKGDDWKKIREQARKQPDNNAVK